MNKIYFIGIGGIGMSALARYFIHEGNSVAGFDRTCTPLTTALEQEGIAIHYDDSEMLIPVEFKGKDTMVIYTPAVGNDNAELHYFQQNGNKIIKRAEALGHITATKNLLAVAGTHGKTTTSTLLAHILTVAGDSCTAFLGGISKNYNNNLLLPQKTAQGSLSANNCIVAEADEYDRSFLQLHPTVAIITSMDADHLDIYGNVDELHKAFVAFINQIVPAGTLIVKKSVSEALKKHASLITYRSSLFTYAYNEVADFYARNICVKQGGYFDFDIVTPFGIIENCTVGAPGWMNVENAVAATAAAVSYWVSICKEPLATHQSSLVDALKSFVGVQRRLDVQVNNERITYIDDYAHHPAELTAAITSVRNMFPNKKITGIFQPHLYTRTRDFAKEFGESLSALDELILLDIYPAREKPIAGITSQIIFDHVSITEKQLCNKKDVLRVLQEKPREVLVTLGAGDIDTLVEPIKKHLQND
ncbi:UDP-N-acetylmuramate--L-alanine ligase [Bacteroidia bacterium]|nr:UDP-N-acetylmuramate--L-alanine ligase [Bacteroidia bacterium]